MGHSIEDYIAARGLDARAIDHEVSALRRREEAYKLAEVRRSRNLTQIELADRLGVSQKRVSQVEHGNLSSLRVGTLERYAEGLGGRLRVVIDLPGDEPIALEG